VAALNANGNHYFPVTQIVNMEPGLGLLEYAQENRLSDQKQPS